LFVSRVLVLNASYEPLAAVPTRRAVVLVLKDKATIVHATDRMLHSARIDVSEPSVIRLNYLVKVPYRARASLNRRAVFARDHHRCQYCGSPAENIDHVVPRSRGGRHIWENVVAACRPCNARKEDRLPDEAGMRLKRRPSAPRGWSWLAAALGAVDPMWEPYLQTARSA
jgi:5-methylcytosine-specific restriction endonuclease McrA